MTTGGALETVNRAAAQALLPWVEDNGWFFDTELLVLAERFGYRVGEVPVAWVDDPDSRVRLVSTAWEDLKGLLRLRRKLRRGAYGSLPGNGQRPREKPATFP